MTWFPIFTSGNFYLNNISNLKKSISKTEKKPSKMASEKEYINNLFEEIEILPAENNNEKCSFL